MNALTQHHDHRVATPQTAAIAHLLAEIDPCFGLFGRYDDAPLAHLAPWPEDLAAVVSELQAALLPAGVEAGANAAAVLIDSYPQRDRSSATYAEMVALRLADCPKDLLIKVVNNLVDRHTEWRPAPGAVKQEVQAVTSRRRLLLLKAEAWQRFWTWKTPSTELRVDPKAVAALAAELGAKIKARPRRALKPVHLVGEHAQRARETAKTQRKG